MIASLLILFALPLFSRQPALNANGPLLLEIFFYGLVFCFVSLGYLGAMPAEAPYVVMSQFFTILYFVIFVLVYFATDYWGEKRRVIRELVPLRPWYEVPAKYSNPFSPYEY
jgi:quinol-cytochrome oxidoreductase complex cytochrome b subunit